MRIALTLLALAVGTIAATADAQKAYEAAATHITTAKLCSGVTGDVGSYESAIEKRRAALVEAGISQQEADEKIATIVGNVPDAAPASFTEKFCRDMLALFER